MKSIPTFAGLVAMALLVNAPQGLAQDDPPPPPPPAEGAEQAPPPGGPEAAEAQTPAAASGTQASTTVSGAPAKSGTAAAPTPVSSGTAVGGPGGPGGGADRVEQFRQRMNEFLKTSLKVTDEEWAIIQPLLEKVQVKQREASGPRMGFFGGRRGGADHRPPGHPSSPDADALKAALDNEATAPADIKVKLDALREARKKAKAELEQAREELRKVLTQRQEATLVLAGILE